MQICYVRWDETCYKEKNKTCRRVCINCVKCCLQVVEMRTESWPLIWHMAVTADLDRHCFCKRKARMDRVQKRIGGMM